MWKLHNTYFDIDVTMIYIFDKYFENRTAPSFIEIVDW